MPEDKLNDQTLSFISDWQKRAGAQQRRHRIALIIALIIAGLTCLALSFWYKHENSDRIISANMRYAQDSALQETNKIENQLMETVKLIEKFAAQYVTLSDKFPDTTTDEKLRILWNNTFFDRISFITPDGTDYSVSGICNVSDRRYFQTGMSGETGFDMIEKSRITLRPSLVFYAPVKENGSIIGVMAGFYERKRLDDMLSYQFLNFNPRTYLLDENGTVIGSSLDETPSANMLDELSKKKFTGDIDFEEIKTAIADEERTSITFHFDDDKNNTSIGVISQFSKGGWMILSVLPHTVTSSMIGNANSVGNIMMITVVITFVFLIAVLIFFMLRQDKRLDKEMSLATDSLRKSTRHDKKQSRIIESLGNTYASVYHVNILKGTYERFKEQELSSLELPETGKWSEGFSGYVKNFVSEPYSTGLLKYCEFPAILERLNVSDQISFEYQRSDKGWRKGFMIPVERDEMGCVISFIFAVQRIEEEKKRELETQQALREAYEGAQLASKAKTTFLSNMSHDIRTPMNAIIGMTAIAGANINNTEKVSDCLKKITSSSKHLLGLINEVLDMSKIESGKVDLSEEMFSLSALIDDLITMNQPLIKEKNHTLIVKVQRLDHENVIGDSTRLQQVFTNLLTNSIKYTPAGGKLEIDITEKETNKASIGFFEVKFKDNGIGMSEEFRQNIFEPFSRAEDERLTEIQGTGLGMPIARNIIRMMNGDIAVESKLNEGSTFTVTFALRLQTDEKLSPEQFVDLPVLVVDDDVIACESTCTILNSLMMKSEWVTSGREAVTKTVERHKCGDDYYALIIDWKMPDMNGIETTKEIRRQVGNDVPIIVISAYDWSDIEQEAKEAGVNAFLSKPIFKSKVIDLFSSFTANKNAEAESEAPKAVPSERDYHGKRILLAEDNELNQEIATELLSMMNLEIVVAENGKLCTEMFQSAPQGHYDLIFMDIQMPVMNGYEAARTIRALDHPDAKTIPIIAMTANAFSTDVRSAFDAGMNGHISKPIDLANVIKTLDEQLK